MADLILELNGKKGLGSNFAGDIDMVVPKPELSIDDDTGLASGFFNPYLRDGYLSPTVVTDVTLTYDTQPTARLSASVYDHSKDIAYFSEYGSKIYKLDGLSDTSFTKIHDLGSGKTIQDIEIYDVNSNKNLFYLYSDTSTVDTLSLDRRGLWITTNVEINPSASTKPSVLYSESVKRGMSTTSHVVVVPSGTNISCIVQVYGTVTTLTLDGVAMTLVGSSSTIFNIATITSSVYKTGNTGSGTKTIALTTSGSATINIVFVENTNVTTPVTIKSYIPGITSSVISTGTYSDSVLSLSFPYVTSAYGEISTTPTITSYEPSAVTGGYGYSISVKPDGTKMYLGAGGSGVANHHIYQFSLGTAYTIASGVTYDSKSVDYSPQFGTDGVSGISFKPDGTKMYLASTNTAPASFSVKQWNLSTAWDVSTATYATGKDLPSATGGNASFIQGISFSSDGLHCYMGGSEGAYFPAIFQYDMTVAWDLSTATYSKKLRLSTLLATSTSLACGPGCTMNADTQFVLQLDVNGDSILALNFNPLYPKDISKCTLAVSSTGTTETFSNASYTPFSTLSSAGNNIYYRRNEGGAAADDVTRLALQSAITPSQSTNTNTISINASANNDEWVAVMLNADSKRIDCGIMSLASNSVKDDTWLSQTLGVSLNSHSGYNFIRKADNGFAYVFTNNRVSKIDGTITGGTNGYVTKDVLTFPETFTITDAVDYRSQLYIAVQQYQNPATLTTSIGSAGVYVWNRISTSIYSAEYLELPGVAKINKIYASPDGVLKLITTSDNGITEIRKYAYNDSRGIIFRVEKTLGIGAYPESPDSFTSIGDKVTWIANDGNMYVEKENIITKIHQIKAPGTGTAGLATNITTGAILYGSGIETSGNNYRTNKQGITYSYLDGSTVYTKRVYPFDLTTGTDAAQTPHQGDVYTKVKYIPIGSNVRTLRIYNAPITGTGTTVIATVKLYFNQSTTASIPTGMTKSITKDEAKRGYVDFKINSSNIQAIQVEIEWSTSVTLGADTYLPSFAVVNYDETKSKSPDSE